MNAIRTLEDWINVGNFYIPYELVCVDALTHCYTAGGTYKVHKEPGKDPYIYNNQGRKSHSSASKFMEATKPFQTVHDRDKEVTEPAFDDETEPSDREKGKTASDGSSTGYYELPEDATELGHLIDAKGMSFNRGNVFKACYRLGEKEGVDLLYDLNKIKFFAERMIEQFHKGQHI